MNKPLRELTLEEFQPQIYINFASLLDTIYGDDPDWEWYEEMGYEFSSCQVEDELEYAIGLGRGMTCWAVSYPWEDYKDDDQQSFIESLPWKHTQSKWNKYKHLILQDLKQHRYSDRWEVDLETLEIK